MIHKFGCDTGHMYGVDCNDKAQAAQEACVEDKVNHPSHYTQGGVEVINILKAKLSTSEFNGFLQGNTIKYLFRYKEKGGAEDLKKARVYLNWLIDRVDLQTSIDTLITGLGQVKKGLRQEATGQADEVPDNDALRTQGIKVGPSYPKDYEDTQGSPIYPEKLLVKKSECGAMIGYCSFCGRK